MRHLVWVLVWVLGLTATAARALPTTEAMLADRVLGKAEAPVTITEYSSFTCSHCAQFSVDTFPKIKSEYIDTGKVRFVFRDFPLNSPSLAAAVVARCLPPERYFGFVEMLFRDQKEWAQHADMKGVLDDLKVRAQLAGLAEADFQACLKNADLIKGLQERAAEAEKKHQINSTPTFLVNGKTLAGALPFADFKTAIDAALAQAK